MILKTIPLDQTVVRTMPVNGTDLITTYGEELAELVFDYVHSSDPVVFDKNKELIRKYYREYKKNPSTDKDQTQTGYFFYKLTKIINLYREFLTTRTWKNPLVVRLVGYGEQRLPTYLVHPGVDRWHVMRHLGIKEWEFLLLENVEFSEDAYTLIKKHFTADTQFHYTWDNKKQWYKFGISVPWSVYDKKHLEQWINDDYVGTTSSIVAAPNSTRRRDWMLKKQMKRKGS